MTGDKPKYFDTIEKPTRRSIKYSGVDSGKKVPTFVPDYVDEEPLYSVIRVLHQEVVVRIEDEIAMKEKAVLVQQSSAATLFE